MEMSEILGGAPAPVEPAAPTTSTVETSPPPAVESATTAVQPVDVPARPRDEQGRFARKDEVDTELHEEKPQHTVPVKALLEERRKRQELEQRLAQQAPPAPPPVKDDDFWQAPTQATQQLVDHRTQDLQQQILNIRYDLAEDMVRQVHQDYDSVKHTFLAALETKDPYAISIAQQMGQYSNPAKFAYDQVKKLEAVKAVGDPDAFRAQVEREVRAKILLEQQQQGRAPAPDVPQSLNSIPSARESSTPGAFAPTPFENIVKFNF